MNPLLVRNPKTLMHSERFKAALTGRVTRGQLLITPKALHIRSHIKKNEEEYGIEQRL